MGVCPVHSALRNGFMCKLQELLGECFQSLDSFGKASLLLGSEMWEYEFCSQLDLVKDYIGIKEG